MAASRHVLLSGGRKIGGGGSVAIPELTVPDMQVNPATGTMELTERINDNNTGTHATGDVIGEYAEIDLGGDFVFNQYRQYGFFLHAGTGRFKIEYYDGEWHDWITGIANTTGAWTDWQVGGEVTGSKIRVTVTTVDTGDDKSLFKEIEVKY